MNLRKVSDIEYSLLPGSDRKTTDIIIERDGSIVVKPPEFIEPEQADEIVWSKRMWIYKNLAEWKDLNRSSVLREWVNGETFLYLGSRYRLLIDDNQEIDLLLKGGRFVIKSTIVNDVKAAKKAFIDFYSDKGIIRLNDRVEHYAKQLGLTPGKIAIKDMSYRWASCGKNNSLQFNWRIIMAPIKIIDYVIVHELCHFNHKNHTVAFWNEIDKVMPDYPERKEWLKNNGASLEL